METTHLGGSFQEAWDAARETLARMRKEGTRVRIVDIKEAWRNYPPLHSSREESTAYTPSFAGLRSDLEAIARSRSDFVAKMLEERKDLTRLDARDLSEHATMLAFVGRADEAIRVLQHAVARFRGVGALTNNLANAHLARGGAETALQLYREALKSEKRPEQAVRIRLNAAVAAHTKGGWALFHPYLKEAIDRATTAGGRAVIDDFLKSLGDEDGLSADGSGALDRQALALRARRLMEGEQRPRSEGRREANAPIVDAVYWLEPDGSTR